MAAIFELQAVSDVGIFAVPYWAGRPRKAVRLRDGAIVEAPWPDRRGEVPDRLDGSLAIGPGGVPATIHHVYLGLIAGRLPLSGVCLLPSGELAAVYGAAAIPIGATAPTAR